MRNVARKNDRHLVYSFGYSYIKEVEAYPNTLLTILFELGVFPGAPLMFYICYCFFRRAWSYPVSIAMFMYLMLLAGDFSQVETVLLCYALSFMSIRPLAAARRPYASSRPVVLCRSLRLRFHPRWRLGNRK